MLPTRNVDTTPRSLGRRRTATRMRSPVRTRAQSFRPASARMCDDGRTAARPCIAADDASDALVHPPHPVGAPPSAIRQKEQL